MEFRNVKYTKNNNISTVSNIEIKIPTICPNCSVANNPSNEYIGSYSNIAAFTHYCFVCAKYHHSIQAIREKVGQILVIYPNHTQSELPDLIKEHFNRSVEMYSDAELAEQNNAFNLAGIGYRATLELLIKDYALEFELDDKETISNISLNNAISKYFKTEPLALNTADVVRILGNDYAHWDKKESTPLSEMKAYLDIFITVINSKLMMKYPPVSRNN